MTMTLIQMRDEMKAKLDGGYRADSANLIDWVNAIDAHLSQPAQAVDVGAVLQVIAEMRAFRYNTPPNWNHLDSFADKLTRALSGEKAGPVGGEVTATDFATAMRNCGLSLATYARVDQEARRLAKQRALLPSSPTPDKEGA